MRYSASVDWRTDAGSERGICRTSPARSRDLRSGQEGPYRRHELERAVSIGGRIVKHNDKPQDIVAMDFDRLTLVMGEKGGKQYAPVNPAATIVAVKGAEVESKPQKGGAFRAALKAFGLIKDDASKADMSDIIEDATERAKRSALFDLIYSFENDVWTVINSELFSADARIEAFLELAGDVFAEKCAALEAAVKAGARHSKEDKADIQTTHDKLGKAIRR